MKTTANPRSVLHALAPIGQGTPEVESLLSYFCRVAVSHSTSTLVLARTVAERVKHEISPGFDWHERQMSGLGESAINWSSALSAVTTVGGLDSLTFLPWRNVISQNGLSTKPHGQFCPLCLAEDRAAGRIPYFRLAWESALVTACYRHRVALHCCCHSCGKNNVRHKSAYVVPGWCTRCGEFLGGSDSSDSDSPPIELAALWRARQIGQLLASQQAQLKLPVREDLIGAVTRIITEMDAGQSAAFARRVGVGKSTVHHWLNRHGTPKLAVSLNISSHCGIALVELLSGDTSRWEPPVPAEQIALDMVTAQRVKRATARELDWAEIETQLTAYLLLPTPIPVLEAARMLDVEARQLYLRVNRTTRRLSARWLAYTRRRQELNVASAWPHLESACRDILAEGRAVTKREITERVPKKVLATVPRLLDVLKAVQCNMSFEER